MSQATVPETAQRSPEGAIPEAWPLALRLKLGSIHPGGTMGSSLLLSGLRVQSGDRVVDLAPGSGETALLTTRENLHSWIGICRDDAEAERVVKAVPGPSVHTQIAAPDATGLPDASASVVMAEGLLFGIPDDRKAAVLRESARILRPEGRLGLHELCIRDVGLSHATTTSIREWMREPENGGMQPLTQAEWREYVASAGLEIVGFTQMELEIPRPRDFVRQLGLRRGLGVVLRASGETGAVTRQSLKVLYRQRGRFSAVVIIARRPMVGALRGNAAVGDEVG
jgi:SAM-dependent methyltransferase